MKYGNCFTFNSYKNSGALLTSSLPGENFGLTVVLDIQQYKYLVNGLTQSAGARVAIHDPELT